MSRAAHRPPRPAIAANFDRVARLYRWAEYLLLGPLLTRTRRSLLPHLEHVQHALVLGDGDGRFLARLLRSAPGLQAVAVDSSASMLALLSRRCAFAAGRLSTRQAIFPPLPDDLDLRQTDLVVSHFVLDCLAPSHLDRLCDDLSRSLPPGSRWLLSDFGIPRRQPWRTAARWYIGALYLAFGALTGLTARSLPDVEATLLRHGFRRTHRVTRLNGFLYTELWQFEPAANAPKQTSGATSS